MKKKAKIKKTIKFVGIPPILNEGRDPLTYDELRELEDKLADIMDEAILFNKDKAMSAADVRNVLKAVREGRSKDILDMVG